VHARDRDAAQRALAEVQRAYRIDAAAAELPPVIHALID
jgi:thymidine phosphorylase